MISEKQSTRLNSFGNKESGGITEGKEEGTMKNKVTVSGLKKTARVMLGMMTFSICLFLFSFESMAAEGTVKPSSAKIRKEANTSSEALASVEAGDKLSIKAKTTGTDGNVWYQVFVDANTLGFIRSDILKDVDGSVAELEVASVQNTENSIQSEPAQAVTTTVEAIPRQSATVTGGDVNVRAGASTSTAKVTTAKNGTAVTITGQATGVDGKVWYQVTFIDSGNEITGFIRSDYIEPGEIIEETPQTEEPAEPETEPEPVQTQNKAYDTVLETKEDGTQEWYLYDNEAGYKYSIPKLMSATQANEESDAALAKQVKQQKVIIIVMIVVIVVLILGLTLLFFKLHDGGSFEDEEEDEEDFEPAPVRRKKVERPAEQPVRRPAQNTTGQQRRPAQNTAGQQRRPAQEGAARPKQSTGQGARTGRTDEGEPVRRPANGQQVRSSSQRRPADGSGTRPAAKPRPSATNMPEREVTYEEEPKPDVKKNQNGQWHSKNFLADDDEFEFEFLNMDDPNRL